MVVAFYEDVRTFSTNLVGRRPAQKRFAHLVPWPGKGSTAGASSAKECVAEYGLKYGLLGGVLGKLGR